MSVGILGLGIILSISSVGAGSQDPTDRFSEVDLDLMMVSSGQSGKVAMFNNAWYAEGDTVEGSQWRIKAIDSERARVTLEDGTLNKVVKLWD